MTTHTTPTPSATPEHAVALTVDEARALALRFAERVAQVERVALRDALGRVLADDIASPFDIPAYDNAAMDGYAFDGAALAAPAADGMLTLAVAGRALAGHPFDGPRVAKDACVRIMTGAQMPTGCDTVIPQEKVEATNDVARFPASAAARGDHCRRAGEDLARGASALAAGRLVRT